MFIFKLYNIHVKFFTLPDDSAQCGTKIKSDLIYFTFFCFYSLVNKDVYNICIVTIYVNLYFLQVAQQSMWGRENDPTQKGMNFASVAATGAPTIGPQPLPNMQNYLESSPPQV